MRFLDYGLIFLIILAAIVRIINPLHYDISVQHDPHLHINGIYSLMDGKIPSYYAAPIYQTWYLIFIVLFPPFVNGTIPDSQMGHLVGLGNFILAIILLVGIYSIGKKLGFSRTQNLLGVALTGSMVPLHSSLNMVRPENIQLAISPWIFLLGYRIFCETKKVNTVKSILCFLLFQILAVLLVFQKVGALAIIATAFIFFFYKKIRSKENVWKIIHTGIFFVIAFAVVVFGWYKLTGNFFLSTPATEDPRYAHKAPISFFSTFPIKKVLLTPYREELKTSMSAILIADFFGDYWRYRYNHYKYTPPPSESVYFLRRQQAGSIFSLLFFLSLIIIMVFLLVKAWKNQKNRSETISVLIMGFLPLLLGLMYLVASSQYQFNPAKANDTKWEYLVFTLPFIWVPVVFFYSKIKTGLPRVAFLGICAMLILFGLFQSVYIL